MPGGRERLNYIETKKLRLAPLGSYCIHYGPAGQRVHVGHKTRARKIYREGCA